VAIEALRSHESLMNVTLIGRWWVFWAVGVRLFFAGVKQTVKPRFTAEEIFKIHDVSVLPLVREIGFGNLSMGVLGIWSLFHRGWVVPAAIVGGLYYAFAAVGHAAQRSRNAKEMTAMISDVFAAVVLLGFVCKTLM
jgi:hypothetical protein